MLGVERQKILFVGGKGGVGKTTIASALALSWADRGARCLLVSTDPAHSLGDLFDARIGDRETPLAPNLHGLEIDPERQVDRHLDGVRRAMREFVRPEMYHEIDRQMELTRLSPGAVEAALLERVADLMLAAGGRYDRVVFDTAPTGQTMRLLSLPEIMSAWTDGLLRHRDRSDALGRVLKGIDSAREAWDARAARVREVLLERRRRFAEARARLMNAGASAFVLVLVPEKLPILESQKAVELLHRFDIAVRGLIVNRTMPEGPAGEFLEQRRQQERPYLDQISRIFGGIPTARVPLLPRGVEGMDSLRVIAGFLRPGAQPLAPDP